MGLEGFTDLAFAFRPRRALSPIVRWSLAVFNFAFVTEVSSSPFLYMSHPSPIRKCGRHLYVGASFFTWAIRYISVEREESLPFFEGPAIASTCTPS